MSTAQADAQAVDATTATTATVSPRTQHPTDVPAARQSPATASADADTTEPVERPAVADSAKAPPLAPALPERRADAPPRPEAAPAEPVGDRDAQLDLESLARCLSALLGSAMPILRIPGGQGAGSPAEHVQAHLGRARRALHRLAGLRAVGVGYGHVLVLLFAYVHLGEERRVGAWHELVRNALLPRALQAGRKGDRAASAALGRRMLLAAEDAYARAPEIASDGRWLAADLATVAELAVRGPKGKPAPRAAVEDERECVACAVLVGELCAKGARLSPKLRYRARSARAACVGASTGAPCVTPTRWRVVAGALLPSLTAQGVVVQGGAGTTWELLRDAAGAEVGR